MNSMNSMIIADISQGNVYPTNYKLYQYDYGRILRIQGMDLPAVVEIDFCLSEKGGDSIKRIGTTVDGVTDVPIPDSMLENNDTADHYYLYAFVYLDDGTSGQTVRKITLKVTARPKPGGIEEDPEREETTFNQIMSAVRQIADGKADTLDYKDNILRLMSGEVELSSVTIAGGSGGTAREIELQKSETAIQWRYTGEETWKDLVQLADITGPAGENGKDGANGQPGTDGAPGQDGVTPHIGDNGNWYIGDTDTGSPSRGEAGPAGKDGATGADGKSAYQYAVEGGYEGTEDDFKDKLAKEYVEPIYKVTMTADDTAPGLEPGKKYIFPDMAALAYTLVPPDDETESAIYWFIFGSPADAATTVTHPEGVTVSGPTISAGKRYEVSIADGLAIIKEWEAAT